MTNFNHQCTFDGSAQLPLEMGRQDSFPMGLDDQLSDFQNNSGEEIWCNNSKQGQVTRNYEPLYLSYNGTNDSFVDFENANPLRWNSETTSLGTVSPKALSLSSSSMSMSTPSSSGSVSLPGSVSMNDDLKFKAGGDRFQNIQSDLSEEQSIVVCPVRRKLPSRPMRKSKFATLPENDGCSKQPAKKKGSKGRQAMVCTPVCSPSHSSHNSNKDNRNGRT